MFIVLPDVVDGVLVNAAWAVAGMVAKTRYSRRTSAALDLAGWADTAALIRDGLPGVRLELPELSDGEAAELAAAVKSHEVQGALQALLAARLTDAPESDAARAREAVRLAIAGAGAGAAGAAGRADRRLRDAVAAARWEEQVAAANSGPEVYTGRQGQQMHVETANELYARRLSEYFDDKVSALVAELEGRVGLDRLAQVRAEAFSGRIVALLGAIERQVAALSEPGRGGQAEAEWLGRYRRQARARHGYLYPPDFDRRRKVRAESIYVNSPVIEHFGSQTVTGIHAINIVEPILALSSGLGQNFGGGTVDLPEPSAIESLTVLDLAGRLDRTVLLGDPGGGKTTAANVLANFFAVDAEERIPFFVTLREYAAKIPPEWSVTGYIEHTIRTLYQCGAPDGLVERLLLTGRAVVIFDGLDELLDTSRRRDVSERVEQFCSAYPLSPVLVTSRIVGYDQARLDDDQFNCYRLGGFGDQEIEEYAGKWFASQAGCPPAEASANAAAFLAESENVPDLRSNPLLLSLMCILYRGAGSLPGDRAGVYARCAELLFRRWDEHRDLYRKVRADHLVEPAIRYLAWWLFTRTDSRAEATERELVAKTTEFLYQRGYETTDDARAAAREFVEFCHGRLWVFSDAGTTADGEKLFGFTHRTFLEYFAAWHLAAVSDTPEDLARTLVERKAWQTGWVVVAEIAIKVKSDTIDRAVDRIYATLLDPTLLSENRAGLLELLARCAQATRPSPMTMRALTRASVKSLPASIIELFSSALFILLQSGTHQELVADELSNIVEMAASSNNKEVCVRWLSFPMEIADLMVVEFWRRWSIEQAAKHAARIGDLAVGSNSLRAAGLKASAISLEQALAMPGGLGALLEETALMTVDDVRRVAHLEEIYRELADGSAVEQAIKDFTLVGKYLVSRPEIPWARCARPRYTQRSELPSLDVGRLGIDELSGLGVMAVLAMLREIAVESRAITLELPMPVEFRQVFKDWAKRRVSFVEFVAE